MDDVTEVMARALCPGDRWTLYVPRAKAALTALSEAGYVVVKREELQRAANIVRRNPHYDEAALRAALKGGDNE